MLRRALGRRRPVSDKPGGEEAAGRNAEAVGLEEPGQAGHDRRASYLGFVAHEVRNPLSTALWTAELLARMAPEERAGARGEKLVAMCLRSVGRVRRLVEDHFLVERLDARGIPLRPEPLAVADLVEAAVSRGPAGAGVLTDLEAGLAVRADRMLCERTLECLIAVAGASGAPVRVRGRREGARVALHVKGDPPRQGSLEDPQRGSPSDARGRSLALAAARRAAAATGGALSIEGEGYALVLPLAEGPLASGGT
jgi:signal transduction histidine kinase